MNARATHCRSSRWIMRLAGSANRVGCLGAETRSRRVLNCTPGSCTEMDVGVMRIDRTGGGIETISPILRYYRSHLVVPSTLSLEQQGFLEGLLDLEAQSPKALIPRLGAAFQDGLPGGVVEQLGDAVLRDEQVFDRPVVEHRRYVAGVVR